MAFALIFKINDTKVVKNNAAEDRSIFEVEASWDSSRRPWREGKLLGSYYHLKPTMCRSLVAYLSRCNLVCMARHGMIN